ncbi:hypothetical protein EYF80_059638 [Liparis tanakae]|uniref:Uncharacterized protein n=1 Tax=Liparis tanakae TaxID=230148 RepID=A0A4Z2ENR2_9TELE|nr:hypothetical protein EYF80_059638 [Liparis tanakae]
MHLVGGAPIGGLWCRLRLSSTTSTSPLPSRAIPKITASTTTSATARRASRSRSVTFGTVWVPEAADQPMDRSVTGETDMLAGGEVKVKEEREVKVKEEREVKVKEERERTVKEERERTVKEEGEDRRYQRNTEV